ncbi:MAG: biotin--[acetyl-CoA-carboxylase] ligase [Nitrososphaerota archaeon]|nr:biotin--[acetyl-CoA-carboxylase] ligase [Nitrososphaerota archaeon]
MSISQRDLIAESELIEALSKEFFVRFKKFNPVCLKVVDSTQDYLTQVLKSSEEGDLVLSEIQTAGKGRAGRVWVSDRGGLWLTIALRPPAPELLDNLSLTVANAVSETLKDFGARDCKVKPPNDIYCVDKKIGGVLVDSVIEGSECLAYVGIGMNINNDVHTNESISKIAISLKEILGKEVLLKQVTVSLLKHLDRDYAKHLS